MKNTRRWPILLVMRVPKNNCCKRTILVISSKTLLRVAYTRKNPNGSRQSLYRPATF